MKLIDSVMMVVTQYWCYFIQNARDLYVGNNPATHLAELSDEQLLGAQPGIRGPPTVHHCHPTKHRGRLLGHRTEGLSILGSALATNYDRQ